MQSMYLVPTSSSRQSYGEVCHMVHWPCLLAKHKTKMNPCSSTYNRTRTPGSRPSAQDTLRSSVKDINPRRDWSPGLMSVVAVFLRHVATQQELTITLTKPFLCRYSSSLHFSILILTRKSINDPGRPWTFDTPD